MLGRFLTFRSELKLSHTSLVDRHTTVVNVNRKFTTVSNEDDESAAMKWLYA